MPGRHSRLPGTGNRLLHGSAPSGAGSPTRTYAMRNPHELGRLDEVAELRR